MLLNMLSAWIPAAETMPARIAVLLTSVVLVGTGAALTLDMRIIANPGDGLVQAVSDRTGIELGLTKNIVDITCVTITCILTMTAAHRIIGVGAGTLIAMLGIGRVIAMINKLFGDRLIPLAAPQKNDKVNDGRYKQSTYHNNAPEKTPGHFTCNIYGIIKQTKGIEHKI